MPTSIRRHDEGTEDMNRRINVTLAATCAFAAVLIASAETPVSSEKPQSSRTQLKQTEGFQLVARLTDGEDVVTAGKPILLTVTLKNVSARSLKLFRTSFLYDFVIQVQDASGRDVEMTELGKQRRRNVEMYISREQLVLAPGRQLETTVELSALYKITKAGAYSITFRRLVPRLSGKGLAELGQTLFE